MKLLIISSRFPYPLEKGDKLRLFYQIQELSQRYEVVLACITDSPVSADSKAKLIPYCTEIHIYRIKWPGIWANLMIGLLKGLPLQIAYFFNPSIKSKIIQLIHRSIPDHIYCQLIRAAEYVKSLPISKTLDYMDCFSHGTIKRAQSSSAWTRWFWNLEANRLSSYESRIYPYFDTHTVISDQDAVNFKFQKDRKITIVSNGLSPDFCHDIPEGSRDIDLLFLGNLQYYSNIQAVGFLIHEILPLCARLVPDIKVVIAGADPDPKLLSWITMSPFPIDIIANPMISRDIYSRAKVFAAPITLGTGQQNKVLEALASGCTVVCSREVSEGLATIKEHLHIADTPEQYASRIIEAYHLFDISSAAHQAAYMSVRNHFSWKHHTMGLIKLLEQK